MTSSMRSAVASRGASVLVAGVAGLVSTGLLVRNLDATGYGLLTLVVTLPLLIPFADLGIGTGITNYVAAAVDGPGRADARRALARGHRLLATAAAVVVVVAATLLVTGVWPTLLGVQDPTGAASRGVTLVAVAFGVALPLGLGERVLYGLHRGALANAVQGGRSVVVLVLTALVAASPAAHSLLAYCAVNAAGIVSAPLACTLISRARLRALGWPRGAGPRERDVRLAEHALPAFVGTIAHAVAYSSDRVVIAHVLDAPAVAVYSLAAVLYVPGYSVAASVGVAVWPSIAHARAVGDHDWARRLLRRWTLGAAVCGVAVVLGLGLLGPPVARLLGGGLVSTPSAIYFAFGGFLATQLVVQPAIGALMRPRGLRRQATVLTAAALVNLPLSVVLASAMGPVGPVVASLLTTGLIYTPALVLAAMARGGVAELDAPATSHAAG